MVEIRIFCGFLFIDAMKLRANERQDVPSYAFGMTLSRLCLDNVFSSHVPHSFFHPLPKLTLNFFKLNHNLNSFEFRRRDGLCIFTRTCANYLLSLVLSHC